MTPACFGPRELRDCKDETTTRLINEPARQRELTQQAAVRLAVQAEPDRAAAAIPLRERRATLWAAHKLPPKTGRPADKVLRRPVGRSVTIFVDASAPIAIVAREPEPWPSLTACKPNRTDIALSAWETVAELCRS